MDTCRTADQRPALQLEQSPMSTDHPNIIYRGPHGLNEIGDRAPDGATRITILAERNTLSHRAALTVSGEHRERLGPDATIEVVQPPEPGITVANYFDFSKHSSAEIDELITEKMQRVDATQPSVFHALDILSTRGDDLQLLNIRKPDPPRVEWVVEGLIPAGVEAGLVAAGGTGKGLLEVALAIHLALGVQWGPFAIPRPRGVLFLALEDDAD